MLDSIFAFFASLHDVSGLIQWGGYVVLMAIIFAETGIFLGFFLPGDSLLVTAGLFAARGDLNVFLLILLCSICAILGDAVGFEIGKVSGKHLLNRPDSRLFKKKHIELTQAFYNKHGGKAIFIARFMPILRTFAPLVAGIAGMSYPSFALYNIVGGIVWICSMVGIGFLLGRSIPNIDEYTHLVIAAVIFLSLLPGIISYARSGHWKKWFKERTA